MNDQIKPEQPNEAHISPSELNAGLGVIAMNDKGQQPGIPMCPKCMKEERRQIGTLSVATQSGARLEDFVHCQYHGNYPIDEMWALRDQGFIGQWVIAPGQCANQDSDVHHQIQKPPADGSERSE